MKTGPIKLGFTLSKKKKREREIIIPLLKYTYIYIYHFRLSVIQKYFSFHKTDSNFEHEYAIVYHAFSCLTSGTFSMYSFFKM